MTQEGALEEAVMPPVRKKFLLKRLSRTRLRRRWTRRWPYALKRLRYNIGRALYKMRVRGRERFCERILEYGSASAICDDLARDMQRHPKEYRGVRGEWLADLYLVAIEDNDFIAADTIAVLVKKRPEGCESKTQVTQFINHIGSHMAAAAPSGGHGRVAFEALERIGYRVNPDDLVATDLLTENRTPPHLVALLGDGEVQQPRAFRDSDTSYRERAVQRKKEKRTTTLHTRGRKGLTTRQLKVRQK